MKRLLLTILLVLPSAVFAWRLRVEKKRTEKERRKKEEALQDLVMARAENARLLGELFCQKVILSENEQQAQWLEETLDRYVDHAVRNARALLPGCKEHQIQRLCFFFAGLSYQAIHALTKDSVASLKESKSRFRKRFLAAGTETGDFLAALLDGPEKMMKGGGPSVPPPPGSKFKFSPLSGPGEIVRRTRRQKSEIPWNNPRDRSNI